MNDFNRHPLYNQYNIDAAISAIFDFYRKNFLVLYVTSVIMTLITRYAFTLIDFNQFQPGTDPMVLLEKLKTMIVPILIITVISLYFSMVLQYYVIYKPVDNSNNILRSAVRSLKYFIPYLIIIILLSFFGSIAFIIGLFILIIGAFFAFLYVSVLYFFILPILVAEGTDIGHVIGRTFRLTHRHFWANAGWVAVFLILVIVASVIFSALVSLPFAGSMFRSITHPGDTSVLNMANNPLYIILSSLLGGLTMPVLPIFAAVLYFNARAGEDESLRKSEEKPVDQLRIEDLYSKPYSDDHPDNPDNRPV